MRIVKLAVDRIRVFLSDIDLMNMQIDANAISPDSPKLSMFLCEVLEAVKDETGFSIEDGQVVAEATPRSDGIILELSHVKQEKKPVRPIKDSIIFEIKGFDCLSEMLKNISAVHLLNMRLYALEENYYVTVPKKRVPAIIYEYSLKCGRSSIVESKIAEYGRLIAAGYRLMQMAAVLKKIN